MRLLIIVDKYPPSTSSAATQMKSLVDDLAKRSTELYIIVPDSTIKHKYTIEKTKNVSLIKFYLKDLNKESYMMRAFYEFSLSFRIIKLVKSIDLFKDINGVIWYSPSIFYGPLISWLKKEYECKTYCILRDIFPQWALDLKIIKKGIAYYILKYFEAKQYQEADYIGIQSKSNRKYFELNYQKHLKKIEILNNWYSDLPQEKCDIDLNSYRSNFDHVMLYAGNIGPAQDLKHLINLFSHKNFSDCLLVFVGEGREKEDLRKSVSSNNILFFDQVPSCQIIDLYKQVDIGIISLDVNHKTHNIPGKLLTYIAAQLPVFAVVNPNNDLISYIEKYKIGTVVQKHDILSMTNSLQQCISMTKADKNIGERCKKMMADNFTTEMIGKRLYDIFTR